MSLIIRLKSMYTFMARKQLERREIELVCFIWSKLLFSSHAYLTLKVIYLSAHSHVYKVPASGYEALDFFLFIKQ